MGSCRVTGSAWKSGRVAEVQNVGFTHRLTLRLVQGELQSRNPLSLLLELIVELRFLGSA
jgi:hypothetical protein